VPLDVLYVESEMIVRRIMLDARASQSRESAVRNLSVDPPKCKMMPFLFWFCVVALEIGPLAAFTVPLAPLPLRSMGMTDQTNVLRPASALEAVKKKMSAAAAAALAAIDPNEGTTKGKAAAAASWEDDEDDTPSLKDLKKAAKKGKQKQQIDIDQVVSSMTTPEGVEKLSKRDAMLQKALALEEADAATSPPDTAEEPKLSGKELKALKKKEEKMAAKWEKKKAKTAAVEEDDDYEDDDDDAATVVGRSSDALPVPTALPDDADPSLARPEEEEEITLEDKIRKERPPPRIRVLDTVPAGFTSLRLEQVGITFRNQEVLRDVTWGVQTGDRIGLVGANGAGKSLV
jgi:ABC-type multidrug transport system fused ATPase/permease subunit